MKSTLFAMVFALTFMINTAFAATVNILCYHEIDSPKILVNNIQQDNIWSISSKNLRAHFEFFRDNGYRVISTDQYLNGDYEGDKNILISFDDGYESFYKIAYPLLKEFSYHAVLAIHNEWFAYRPSDVGALVTMEQMQEMSASGFVEIGSHTYSMHKNRPVNPQGSVSSVVENRLYIDNRYETTEEYETRINNDLASVQEFFMKNFGKKARVLVWPYGRFSGRAMDVALKNGFQLSFLLNGGVNSSESNKIYSQRIIIYSDCEVKTLEKMLTKATDDWKINPIKMAQVDLDQIYSEDSKKLDENIDALIARLQAERYTAVALQAFCDENGDGLLKNVYFYTKNAPIKADIFGHVANKLSQSDIRVIAWMPTISATWLSANPQDLVKAMPEENIGWYKRATPFSPQVESKLIALYEDLSNYSNIDGILIQDDLYMNDFEDFSDYAKQAFYEKYQYQLNENNFQEANVKNDLLQLKIAKMDELSNKLVAAVRKNRPVAVSMRNIYAEAVLNKQAKDWYAQDYQEFLKNYDYVVIMAYPYMENQEKQPIAWLQNLAKVADAPNAQFNNKLIFKLQKYDWKTNTWISDKDINKQINSLKQSGAKHIAAYPINSNN